MRCTCVSTPMPTLSPMLCICRNAILGPTPGSEHRSSIVRGTSPPKRSRRISAARRRYSVLRRKKPTLAMHSWMTSSGVSSSDARHRPLGRRVCSLCTASAVTGSLVCELSIRLTRVVKRRRRAISSSDSGCPSGPVRPRSARRSSCPFSSQPMVSTGVMISSRCFESRAYTSRQCLGTLTLRFSSSVSSILIFLRGESLVPAPTSTSTVASLSTSSSSSILGSGLTSGEGGVRCARVCTPRVGVAGAGGVAGAAWRAERRRAAAGQRLRLASTYVVRRCARGTPANPRRGSAAPASAPGRAPRRAPRPWRAWRCRCRVRR
mgnify:CR=1 FL=1